MSNDVISLIDEAVNDWITSGDAMRWKPPEPVWDEPIVRKPKNPVEELMLYHGMDGYAATAAARLMVMEFTTIMQRSLRNSMHQFATAVNNVAIQLRPIFDQINNIGSFTASETQCVARPILVRPVIVPRDGRPAWQTPYNPRDRRQ